MAVWVDESPPIKPLHQILAGSKLEIMDNSRECKIDVAF